MEAPSSYFTKRARQERTSAIGATSSEARAAHLELAVRLVKVATEQPLPTNSVDWLQREALRDRAIHLHLALHKAFPCANSIDFDQLLSRLS